MQFDLHFTEVFRGVDVTPLTNKGADFLYGGPDDPDPEELLAITIADAREVYNVAVARNLHVSFDTAATRDLFASYSVALHNPQADPEAAV